MWVYVIVAISVALLWMRFGYNIENNRPEIVRLVIVIANVMIIIGVVSHFIKNRSRKKKDNCEA